MIDARKPHAVLDAVGPEVVDALGRIVRGAREDLARYRSTFPEWVVGATARATKSWIHDRLFDHVRAEFDDAPYVTVKTAEPTLEFMVHSRFRFPLKAHGLQDILSTYPTNGALQYMRQGSQPSFPDLSEIRLVAGYRWDSELMEMNEAVITMRNGRRCIWAVELREDDVSNSIGQFSPYAIAPAPSIDVKLPGLSESADG